MDSTHGAGRAPTLVIPGGLLPREGWGVSNPEIPLYRFVVVVFFFNALNWFSTMAIPGPGMTYT